MELLATIAIIGLLAGLLLPAVQSAREGARRMRCHANLREIGVGLQSYAAAIGAFPPGDLRASGPDGSAYWQGATTMYLLPYIEQVRLSEGYCMVDPAPFTYATFADAARAATGVTSLNNGWAKVPGTNQNVQGVSVSTYLCPSDHPASPLPASLAAQTNYGSARFNYISSCGPIATYAPCPDLNNAFFNSYKRRNTRPVGVPGVFGSFADVVEFIEGKAFNSTSTARYSFAQVRCPMAAITDGLSNTILFGEARPDCSGIMFTAGWGMGGNGCGAGNTIIPLNYDSCGTGPTGSSTDCSLPFRSNPAGEGFRSRHPGGVSFLMGDGVVKFIGDTINHQLLQRLGAKADGELLDAY